MTAVLLLILAVAADPGDPAQSKKADVTNLDDKTVSQQPLQSVIDNVASIGASFIPGLQESTGNKQSVSDSSNTIVWVRLSKDFLADHVERDVDRTKPVQDYILGTTISGQSRTTGKTKLILQPNEDRAAGRVEFSGETHGRVIGHNGPATLHFNTDSTFRA